MNRGEYFMGLEPGYSQESIDRMFGRDFETVRGVGSRTIEDLLSLAGREGLVGTQATRDLGQQSAWQTERSIGQIIEDLFLAEEAQRREDLYGYTGAAQDIFRGAQTFEGLREQLNAGRRGEGQQALALMMQYLMALMQSWGA
jgi:hypothetical protein